VTTPRRRENSVVGRVVTCNRFIDLLCVAQVVRTHTKPIQTTNDDGSNYDTRAKRAIHKERMGEERDEGPIRRRE
jgi:hypothetical protein